MFYATKKRGKQTQKLSKLDFLPDTELQLILCHETYSSGQNLLLNYRQTWIAPLLHLSKLLSQCVIGEDWF